MDIVIDKSIPAYRLVETLQNLIHEIGKPKQIRSDNGSEFISSTFISWCNKNNIEIKYIEPGKPLQNAFVERFNGSYRKEILDAYIFYSIEQVRVITNQWLELYNNERPHASLNNKPPIVFYNRFKKLV